tara:strand:+ start:3142 stop:3828 length:687 start_codon:yes stop_codon:yes gene_type:complete
MKSIINILLFLKYRLKLNRLRNSKEVNFLCKKPTILTIDNFLSLEDCEHFINCSKGKLERGLGSNLNKIIQRTGTVNFISVNHDEITKKLVKRICYLIGMRPANLEPIQIGHYKVGQFYAYHYDAFDKTGMELDKRNGFRQRIFTAIIYLNNPLKGGSTRFRHVDIDIKPQLGRVLLFSNVIDFSEKLDKDSLHSGLPVEEGEKWILTLWFNSFTFNKFFSKFKITEI